MTTYQRIPALTRRCVDCRYDQTRYFPATRVSPEDVAVGCAVLDDEERPPGSDALRRYGDDTVDYIIENGGCPAWQPRPPCSRHQLPVFPDGDCERCHEEITRAELDAAAESVRLEGAEAFAYAERTGASLSTHGVGEESGRTGLALHEAHAIAVEDPSAIYVDVAELTRPLLDLLPMVSEACSKVGARFRVKASRLQGRGQPHAIEIETLDGRTIEIEADDDLAKHRSTALRGAWVETDAESLQAELETEQ